MAGRPVCGNDTSGGQAVEQMPSSTLSLRGGLGGTAVMRPRTLPLEVSTLGALSVPALIYETARQDRGMSS
jgi:hypothetical protein